MAGDYTRQQQNAARQIANAGRTVTLLIPVESTKSNNGFERNNIANRADDIEQTITVLQTRFDRSLIDGANIRTSDIRFLVSGDVKLSTSYRIRDDNGQIYEIRNIEALNPASPVILFEVHCR